MTGDTGDSAFQDEMRMLRDSVRLLLERAGGLKRVRQARDLPEGWHKAVMRELAGAGVLGVAAPENIGGLGMGLSAAGAIAEEIGRMAAPEPVGPTLGLAIGLLERLCPGSDLLPAVIGGDATVAVAWQERGANGAPGGIDCRFDGRALTGGKAWVMGAGGADALLVVAQGPDGPVLLHLAPEAAGVTLTPRRQSDGSSQHDIAFAATPAGILAQGPAVTAALEDAVAVTTALAAAELVGVSARALELTLDYLGTREQFGQPIGAFQAIQHRAVDIYTMQQVAEATLREVLARMGSATPQERARLASRAKARACTAAQKITREAIQMHGAVGYTDEFDISLLLNRALVLSAWLGGAAFHRRRWLDATESMEAAQ